MKLVDADLVRNVLSRCMKEIRKANNDISEEKFNREFEIYTSVLDAIRETTAPELNIIQAKYEGWIPCKKKLPDKGANVILTFKDTFHTHSSWPKVAVMPAWICNVDGENPKGMWAIEGRLGNYIVDIEDGIAWMPLPEPFRKAEQLEKGEE